MKARLSESTSFIKNYSPLEVDIMMRAFGKLYVISFLEQPLCKEAGDRHCFKFSLMMGLYCLKQITQLTSFNVQNYGGNMQ